MCVCVRGVCACVCNYTNTERTERSILQEYAKSIFSKDAIPKQNDKLQQQCPFFELAPVFLKGENNDVTGSEGQQTFNKRFPAQAENIYLHGHDLSQLKARLY